MHEKSKVFKKVTFRKRVIIETQVLLKIMKNDKNVLQGDLKSKFTLAHIELYSIQMYNYVLNMYRNKCKYTMQFQGAVSNTNHFGSIHWELFGTHMSM